MVISGIVEEIEQLLREARDPSADRLTALRTDAERGDREDVVVKLTSGDIWNHMGSLFDRCLSDPGLDRQFRQAQVRLADALESAGVATRDVNEWAALLRTIE